MTTSHEKIQQIKDLKAKGLNQFQIAERLECTQSNICYLSRTYGIEWPKPSFIDGMGKSTIERLTRRVVLESDRCLYTCERCNDFNKETERHRHHKDRDRSNNEPTNLEVLCTSCHTLEHAKERVRGDHGRYIA